MEVRTQYNNGAMEEVEVTVYRRIRPGMTLRINPSEAMLGIDSGVIKIQHITDLAGLLEIDENLSQQADNFGNIQLDMLVDDAKAMADELERLSETWVVYEYMYDAGEQYVLPLEEFIEHTMQY